MYEYKITLEIKSSKDVSILGITGDTIRGSLMRKEYHYNIISRIVNNSEKMEIVNITKKEV